MHPSPASKVIAFPLRKRKKRRTEKRIRTTDTVRYYSPLQIKALRRAARNKAELDAAKGRIAGVREWMAIDLLTSSGLRVSEAAALKCGDLRIAYGQSKIFVRSGKGGISGSVIINGSLKKHLKEFINWKRQRNETVSPDDYLFLGQRGPWTSQAIQCITKKYLRQLGLYESGKSCHSLRHSFAVALYGKEKDLRTVQKQLRHISIQSTLLYADVTDEEIAEQVKGLWN